MKTPTLDEATEAYAAEPSYDTALVLAATVQEYFDDGMISTSQRDLTLLRVQDQLCQSPRR
jgi:hypothetical protein